MAPRECKICAHSDTRKMEKLFIQGKPKTQIARQFDVPNQSVDYHMDNHLSQKLVRQFKKKEQKHAENILDGINDLLERTKSILAQAEEDGQKTTALSAIREARSTYELLSKIAVKLEEYRRQDEKKKDQRANSQIGDGLKVLTDTELKALIQLQTKIYLSNPDHELDPEARAVVQAVTQRGYASVASNDEDNLSQNRSSENRNSQNQKDDAEEEPEMIDDLELDDLKLDDLSDDEISSEKDDPNFLKRERRRRRR